MITFIVGKRNKLFETALQKAILGMDMERRNVTTETVASLFDEVCTPSLFGDKKVFAISGLDESADAKELFFDRSETIQNAAHDMVVIMEGLLAADTRKAEKFATVVKIAEPKIATAGAFNPFSLANAFATGDKKSTWIAYQQVLAHSDEIEPLHGMIWWKLKDMAAKKSLPTERLQTLARELVSVYHESRLGGLGMRERLEKFFLTM